MDVTCDNCKAEYDFDDTLLGDKGTTVKCSKCGHVFRVLPPRREPTRSALKVRFRDGHIESVASLRELQQRIQAGTVGMDDELGRDGFTFRRLSDVPELKNFFTRPSPASGPVPTPGNVGTAATQAASAALTAAVKQPAQDLPHRGEPRPAPKRTMLGIGDVPAAPRVPNFGPMAAAQALAPTQPAALNPKNTVQGRAPISSAPTAPNMAIPPREPEKRREDPSQRVPTSSAPTPTGTAPTMPASPSYIPSAAPTPSITIPAPAIASTQPASVPKAAPAHRPAGPALRIPDALSENPARPQAPVSAPSRGLGTDSIAPGMLKAFANKPSSGAPRPAPGAAAVHLSLDEDEPRRPNSPPQASSKVMLYAGVLAVLAGAGWIISRQLAPSEPLATPALTPATPAAAVPEVPDANAAAAAPTAEAPNTAAPNTEPKAVEEPAQATPEPAQQVPATASAKVEKPQLKPQPSPASSSDRPKDGTSEGGASNGREPKDYSGWVGRGEQLLKRGDMPAAQQAFEQAVALRGTGSEANSGMGTLLLAQGQTREAIPYLSRAANNGFAEASVGLGDAYRKLGQKEAAIEAYETYLARLPKGARASYVKLQLEGLGQDTGGAKAAPPAHSEPSAAPGGDYRPAGELTDPPPADPKPPATETPQ